MEDISDSERRRAFSRWLRTGHLTSIRGPDGIEHKFNPWHDPDTGRFTFANTGVYFARGFKGAGGDFGGGGATGGGWPGSKRKIRSVERFPIANRATPSKAAAKPRAPIAAPFREVSRNGYLYQIDDGGRTRGVSGPLTTGVTAVRSRRTQLDAGKPDRRRGDDGGHYIAARFNGPAEAFNHFAQDRNFNRSGYNTLEKEWEREKRRGKSVRVPIVPSYVDRSVRPDVIDVFFIVDGEQKSQKFFNESGKVAHGK